LEVFMAAAKVTMSDVGLLVLRVAGAYLAVHGFEKVSAGVQDPANWSFVGTVKSMNFPLPHVFAWAAALSELVGGAAVALGVYTRVAALACAVTMFVAAFIKHGDDGFGKMEAALVYLSVFLGLAFLGGGRLSVDAKWRKG
jgi:putative oxidoreductase